MPDSKCGSGTPRSVLHGTNAIYIATAKPCYTTLIIKTNNSHFHQADQDVNGTDKALKLKVTHDTIFFKKQIVQSRN